MVLLLWLLVVLEAPSDLGSVQDLAGTDVKTSTGQALLASLALGDSSMLQSRARKLQKAVAVGDSPASEALRDGPELGARTAAAGAAGAGKRAAGGSHTAPAWSAPLAAVRGLREDQDSHGSAGDAVAALGPSAQDMVAVHMLRLYEKYSRQGARPGGGNTVRSFRARMEVVDQKAMYFFNLTSMQDSEMILTATFHFYTEPPRWPQVREAMCKPPRAKNASCRLLPPGPPARQHLLFRSLSQNSATQGLLRGAMTLVPPPRGLWQAKDISARARGDGELLLSAQLDSGEKELGVPKPSPRGPYILIYANDLAIAEPNSVAVTLQRYDPFPAGDPEPRAAPNSSADPRVRRAAQVSGPLLDNELPGLDERPAHAPHAHHYHKHELWPSPFRALKPRPGRKDRRKKGQDTFLGSSQVLDFDEKTMQKARRKQWDEPRVCSRRYLKVDFADIGWSEWVLSPKSFDAYYCAGACEFPMPKKDRPNSPMSPGREEVVRPSNHATIQSIVRAVGIVPGIPEPCCVPDKMNSLGVLFLDENRNVVLKVYPNMSVETCACRLSNAQGLAQQLAQRCHTGRRIPQE
ncbi:Bone morphogenetic protein 3B [Tupaia chinensis]|uniref:Growth/differentiation factor 10 n=1 Tax=Tupaia chinensis TaxID=246437 RepID=L9KUQ2_TUPCH|nr:Bone morphogenetic protein 3B [Tupaia chinensis]